MYLHMQKYCKYMQKEFNNSNYVGGRKVVGETRQMVNSSAKDG